MVLAILPFFSHTLIALDSDGDGFLDARENQYDWNTTLVDERRKGGISRSKSSIIGINLGGGAVVQVSSDPAGLFSPTSDGLATGNELTTPTIQTTTNNKRFLYWERNGVIVRGPGGTPKPAVTESSPGNGVQLVAKYLDVDQDSDGDGILDWLEMRASNLTLTPQSDNDADGFSLAQEQNYGFSPTLKDSRTRGGISRSRGSVIGVNLGGGGVLNIGSDPKGIVNDVSQPLANGGSFDTVILEPKDGNKRFVYWQRMGVPVRSAGGTPSPRVTENDISSGVNMIAKYVDEDKDSDSDGLLDWFELRAGGLAFLPDSDPDGDGFTLAQEHRYGFSPFLRDLRPKGGVSRRRSQAIALVAKEDVPAPTGFADLDGDGITDLLDFDTDGDGSSDAEEFINGSGQSDANSTRLLQTVALQNIFKIDFGHGSSNPLQTDWKSFGSSADSPNLIEHNFTTPLATTGNLKIGVQGQSHWRDYRSVSSGPHKELSNLLSDSVFSNNGGTITISLSGLEVGHYQMTTYHHATEGHGNTSYNLRKTDATGTDQLQFSGIKSSGGSSPLEITTRSFTLIVDQNDSTVSVKVGPGGSNGNHMAINGFVLGKVTGTAPYNLTLSNASLAENPVHGSLVATFQGSDLENNSSFNYYFSDGIGDFHNSLFNLSNQGELTAASGIDFEQNTHLFLRVKVMDDSNNSLEKIFTLSVTDVFEDLDGDGIEDHLDHDLDGDGFINSNETAYGSDPRDPNSVANAPPADLNVSASVFTLFENEPVGTLIGDFNATDPDPWATLSYTLHGPSAHLFAIDSNGTLSSNSIFNFENDPIIYSIVVRVSDEHNASDSVTREIHLLNRNESPRDLALITQGLYENLAVGSIIAEFNASDPDANASLFYSFKEGNRSNDNGLFQLSNHGILSTAVVFDYESNRSSYSIQLSVSDEHNFSMEGNYSISLLDNNDPPSDLNSTAPLQVAENQPVGTVFGQLNASDPDANATLAYTLVDGAMHNHFFTIDNNGSLRTAVKIDFESNNSLIIRAQVRDQQNVSIMKNFTVHVSNQNDHPVIHSFSPGTLDTIVQVHENTSFVLDVNASDQDGDNLSFSKTAGADRNLFDLNASSGRLTLKSLPDFENPTDADSNNTYEVWFRVNDGLGGFAEKCLILQVINVIEDQDGDGIEDAYDFDDDNDGFSNAVEIAYGSDPMDANSTANVPPNELNAPSVLQVSENQPEGFTIGQFTANDPDENSTLTFTLFVGENDNHLFSIDSNGTLRTATVFDYESNSSYTIRVKVRDQHNLWIKENFVVQITNTIEDFDGDGTEDYFDTDDDNDGFSDAEEIVYGSDPMDANSTANASPTNLNATSALQVAENQSVGTVVGQLTATDPDANATLTFTLIDGSNDNHLFSIDANGTLRTTTVFDFESNSSFTIRAKVKDQFNLWIEKNFIVQITKIIEDLDGDGIEDHIDNDYDEQVKSIEINSSWWSTLPESEGGWRTSPWFGFFRPYPGGWLYHVDLGWLFSHAGESRDLWLWNEQLGWHWTAQGVYPHLFLHSSANWLYFITKKDGRPYFYDYDTGKLK